MSAHRVRDSLVSPSQGLCSTLPGIIRLVAAFPLDVAAQARALDVTHGVAGKHGVERRPQVLSRDRDRVTGPAPVELAAVNQLLVLVEDVEIGRAGRLVRSGDLLRLV